LDTDLAPGFMRSQLVCPQMLDLRIYRMAFIPAVLAVIIAGFALGNRPAPAVSTLAPDAFDGAHASSLGSGLARAYPDRRPGGSGDEGVAGVMAGWFATVPGFTVSIDRFQGRTIAGTRTLENVVAVRPGPLPGAIVLVAHRDAARSPGKAELSGTAALMEFAQVFSGRVTQHAIVLASTSGGSGGDAGAARLAKHLGVPVDAVIVLGDLGGPRSREPHVVPWSDGQQLAPVLLANTVASGLAQELGRLPRAPGALEQLARLAFPLTVGEQGPFNAAGIPAVLVQSSGELGPHANDKPSADRMGVYGRGVLRAVNALDAGRPVPRPSVQVAFGRRTMPGWPISLLVVSLIAPVLLASVDVLARARRRRERVGMWVCWTLVTALPFFAAAAFAWLLGHTGILRAAPAEPVSAQNLPLDAGGRTALISVLVVFALVWLLRPRLSRRLGAAGPPAEAGAAAAVVLVAVTLACFAWIFNPFTAALLVLPLHVWLLALTSDQPLPRWLAMALMALSLVPLAGLAALDAAHLGLGPLALAWTVMLLVAGGHVGLTSAIGWSIALGCTVSAFLVLLRRRRVPAEPIAVTVRGPITYAGPGSLGGTESALRR
jgi:hypothetical protein